MLNIKELSVGQKVHYQPDYFDDNHWENGIIKEIRENNTTGVFVVYHCAGRWENFKQYTSALTNLRDLKDGWR